MKKISEMTSLASGSAASTDEVEVARSTAATSFRMSLSALSTYVKAFSTALVATTGTFSGAVSMTALTATTGTFSGTISAAIAGLTSPVKIGQVSDGVTYGTLTFNSTFTGAGLVGLLAGASGDDSMYVQGGATGGVKLRVAGTTKLSVTGATCTIDSTTTAVQALTGTTASMTATGLVFSATGATTNARFARYANTTGSLLIGVDNSAGANNFGTGAAYAATIGTETATPLIFYSGGSWRLGIVGAAGTPANSSVGNIFILNSTAPTGNPTGMGYLWVEAGALKYRGTSGTVTTIAVA